MFKFSWPNLSPTTTPKATTVMPNPFDSIPTSAPTTQQQPPQNIPANNSNGVAVAKKPHQLLQVNENVAGITPGPPSSLASPLQAAAPTTQLSLHPPEFTLTLPKKQPKQMQEVSSMPQPTPKSSTAAPRGQLHVKLIQARNLNVKSSRSRPYVVVVYEQNEFISREPTHESEKEVRGVPAPLSRQNSTPAIAVLGGIQEAFGIKPKPAQASPSDGSSSRSSSGSSGSSKGQVKKQLKPSPSSSPTKSNVTSAPPPVSIASFANNLSAMNPVWKHQVSFDVTSEHSVLALNIYDREFEGIEGYLGTVEIKPALIHDRAADMWHDLESSGGSGAVTGQLRVQITYEQSKSKRSLTPRDFEILKLIGKGTFGRVFQVRKRDTKRIYAMKVLSKKEIVAKKEVAHTIGERKILQRSLESPFLVGLKFSFQTDAELFLVTDFKSGGELFWHLQRETRFSEERARFYIAELTLALEHLHKHDIVYRDLKPENILLDATGHVALCDFGLSKPDLPSNQLTNTFCGTTEYLAPEILLDDLGYSKMVDFWSLGVLLFEMLCGWSPFYNEDTQVMYRNICYGKIKFPRNTVSEDGKQFVKGLLNRVPTNRLGSKGDAAELKAHPFFSCIDWTALSKKEITPPFKPDVESDECTANFDPEFTSADLKDVGVDYWDEEETDGQMRTYHGPTGSEPLVVPGVGAPPEGAIDIAVGQMTTPVGSFRGNGISTTNTRPRKRSMSPISSSIQENFRGFSYTAESVDAWGGGTLGQRMRDEDRREQEKLRRAVESAVGDEEISVELRQLDLDESARDYEDYTIGYHRQIPATTNAYARY